jgi:methylase of polypeptide subunit release factors
LYLALLVPTTQVSSSDVVLELGCSYGICTNMLAEHAAHVIGVDNSEEAVAEASIDHCNATVFMLLCMLHIVCCSILGVDTQRKHAALHV